MCHLFFSDRILVLVRFCPEHLLSIEDDKSVLDVIVDNVPRCRLLPLRVVMPELPASDIPDPVQRVTVCGSGCSFPGFCSGDLFRMPAAAG